MQRADLDGADVDVFEVDPVPLVEPPWKHSSTTVVASGNEKRPGQRQTLGACLRGRKLRGVRGSICGSASLDEVARVGPITGPKVSNAGVAVHEIVAGREVQLGELERRRSGGWYIQVAEEGRVRVTRPAQASRPVTPLRPDRAACPGRTGLDRRGRRGRRGRPEAGLT